jgi:hypothetical protein
MSKTRAFLPRATTTRFAERASSSAASRPLRSFAALTTVPPADQLAASRNARDFSQPVQPLRWYSQSIVPGMRASSWGRFPNLPLLEEAG